MAGNSCLSRVALVLLARPRLEDEAQKADEAVQKSEVTCRLVSKATPNVSHERRICSRYIKLKSCGGKQATVAIRLKTRSSWALANDLSECGQCGLLSRADQPDGRVYARWLIRYIQIHEPVLLPGFLSAIEHWHKSSADWLPTFTSDFKFSTSSGNIKSTC